MLQRIVTAVLIALAPLPAAAQNFHVTPGNATVQDSAQDCVTPGGVAVPAPNPGVGCNATMIQGNATGTTGAVVGTLTSASGKTAFLCDFDVQAAGGTAAIGPITIAGLLGGSRVYQATSLATGGQVAGKSFSPCLPASAVNTNITITTTADGTATAVDVNSSGYLQ